MVNYSMLVLRGTSVIASPLGSNYTCSKIATCCNKMAKLATKERTMFFWYTEHFYVFGVFPHPEDLYSFSAFSTFEAFQVI